MIRRARIRALLRKYSNAEVRYAVALPTDGPDVFRLLPDIGTLISRQGWRCERYNGPVNLLCSDDAPNWRGMEAFAVLLKNFGQVYSAAVFQGGQLQVFRLRGRI